MTASVVACAGSSPHSEDERILPMESPLSRRSVICITHDGCYPEKWFGLNTNIEPNPLEEGYDHENPVLEFHLSYLWCAAW